MPDTTVKHNSFLVTLIQSVHLHKHKTEYLLREAMSIPKSRSTNNAFCPSYANVTPTAQHKYQCVKTNKEFKTDISVTKTCTFKMYQHADAGKQTHHRCQEWADAKAEGLEM